MGGEGGYHGARTMVPDGSFPDDDGQRTPLMPRPSRRRHKRFNAIGECFAQIGGGWEGSVVNLSVGGMLLRLQRGLTPGSSYVVKLLFDHQVAVVEARVVRLDELDDESRAGMEFTAMSLEDRAQLRRYLRG
jgi:c-di-GMP-binding flagellar brake protein YcgR